MNHPRRPVRLAVAALVALAPVGLAACGDDTEEAGDDTTTTTEAAETAAPTVSDAWARPGATGGNSAIYMMIEGGDEDTALTRAELPDGVARTIELHETTTMAEGSEGSDDMAGMDDSGMEGMDGMEGMEGMDGSDTTMGDMSGEGDMDMDHGGSGMMTMREVPEIEVPAGQTVELKPGGFHVMLLDLERDLTAGETLDVTLTFSDGATVDVTAEVREP